MSNNICDNCIYPCKELNRTVCVQYTTIREMEKPEPPAMPPKAIQEMSFTDKYSLSKEVLTIRQHFAFEFAKIFLKNDLDIEVVSDSKEVTLPRDPASSNARWAVNQADELIKALNKEKE